MKNLSNLMFSMMENGAHIRVKNNFDNEKPFIFAVDLSTDVITVKEQVGSTLLIEYKTHSYNNASDTKIHTFLTDFSNAEDFIIAYPKYLERKVNDIDENDLKEYQNFILTKINDRTLIKVNVIKEKSWELTYNHPKTQSEFLTCFENELENEVKFLNIVTYIRDLNLEFAQQVHILIPALHLDNYEHLKCVIVKNKQQNKIDPLNFMINNAIGEKMNKIAFNHHLTQSMITQDKIKNKKAKL